MFFSSQANQDLDISRSSGFREMRTKNADDETDEDDEADEDGTTLASQRRVLSAGKVVGPFEKEGCLARSRHRLGTAPPIREAAIGGDGFSACQTLYGVCECAPPGFASSRPRGLRVRAPDPCSVV